MKQKTRPLYSLTVHEAAQRKLLPAGLLLLVLALGWSISADAAAEAGNEAADGDKHAGYVDSIHKWGAWELDIEPAAGGIHAARQKPLMARNSRVSLRTNSVSALAPQPPQRSTGASPAPVPPPPAAPTAPAIRPISPTIPIPSSAPSDGF